MPVNSRDDINIDEYLLSLFNLGFRERDLHNLRFRFLGGDIAHKIRFVSSLDVRNCCYVVRFAPDDNTSWFASKNHIIHDSACPHPFTVIAPTLIANMWE